MPIVRYPVSITLTGLPPSDPVPGTYADVIFTAGATDGGTSVLPPGFQMALYADAPASISSSGGIVSAWGQANVATGSPALGTDSVSGGQFIRTYTGANLATASGVADFLTTGPSTVIMVCRSRVYNTGTTYPALDTSNAGAGKGYQLQVSQVAGQKVIPRINNGSSWILDASGTEQGQFIEQKWFIVAVRASNTRYDVRFDGQFIAVGGTAIAIAYPGTTGHPLKIGGGPFDYRAIELYSSYLTDVDVAAAEVRLAARFGVDLLQVIGGDPTLTTSTSALFPYMSKLPSGKPYVTLFRGSDENPHNTNYVESRVSTDTVGSGWAAPVTLVTGSSSLRYSDFHTSEVLSDGTVFQHWFVYDGLDNIQTYLQWRKSTGYNVDGSPIWGTTNNLNVAGVVWVASGAQMVEDPFNAGRYFLPAFAIQTGHTNENIYLLRSLNSGGAWTLIKVADGDTDVRRYAENAFWFESASELRCLTRVVGGNQQYASRSTDGGTTWNTPVASGAGFTSSAQGYKKLASGAYVAGPGRTTGSFQQSSMFYLPPGSAWNSQWTSPPNTPYVDPFFGGNYYGGSVEVSPGNLTLVFGRSSSINQNNNVSVRTNFYEWYMTHKMPGSASPTSASVTVSNTQVISLTGAGDYTAVFDSNQSGANVVVSGEQATYTAGVANGTDTFHFVDANGFTTQSCTYTVSGASSIDPTLLPGANLVLRADHATNTGNGTPVTAWNDEMALHNMVQPTSGNRLTYNSSGINSKPDITGTGNPRVMYADGAALGTTALSLTACVSFTNIATDQFIFGARYNNYHYDLGTDTVNAGQFVFRLNTSVTGLVVIKGDSTALNDGNRHTVTGSWDGTTMKMYVDGVLQAQTASCTGTLVVPSTNSDVNSIGASCNNANLSGNNFVGRIKGANASNQACSAGNAALLATWYAGL